MNDIQIAYITDREMFWPSIVSMMSALEGTRSPVTVHFFGYQLSQEEFDHLMNAVRHWPETQVICHEVTEDMVEGAAVNHYYPPPHIALIRIPQLLSGKVLCLDGDTIVHGDIAALFDLDMKGNFVAAVRDFAGMWQFMKRLPEQVVHEQMEWEMMSPHHLSDKFNSGVLLFDLDAMHAIPGMADKVAERMGHREDQRVLNLHLKDHVHYLDPAWNVMPGTFHLIRPLQVSLTKDRAFSAQAPQITHFVGIVKPWHEFDTDQMRGDLTRMRHELLYGHGYAEGDRFNVSHIFPFLDNDQMVSEYITAVNSYRNSYARFMSMV